MTDIELFTGDLEPPLELTLGGDTPVDLTQADSVLIIGTRDKGVTVAFSRAPTSIEKIGDVSVVKMNWEPDDTAEPCTMRFEAEVVWPGGRPETFRPDDRAHIRRDYGGTAP